MPTDPPNAPGVDPERFDPPLRLLAHVLADEPGGDGRVQFVRDLAAGDPADPALDVLATWFGRARSH